MRVKVIREQACNECEGEGTFRDTSGKRAKTKICPQCDGLGYIEIESSLPFSMLVDCVVTEIKKRRIK